MIDVPLLALVVFGLTYVVVGFGSLPTLRVDRTGATLIGATAMVACGALTPAQAVGALDFHTLALLFGMMVVVAHLRLSGFFGWLADRVLARARTPRAALAVLVLLSGALSALFVNDTACLLLTPLALETAVAVGAPPVPFLLAVAMGANAGSVATLVGNPQNMLVGSFSGIGFARFSATLAPVALLALAATVLALRLAYRRELAGPGGAVAPAPPRPLNAPMFRKTAIVAAAMLVALLAGVPPGLAAMSAASVLLVTRRVRPARVWSHVDWSLLAMFAGLFVVVRGIEATGWTARALAIVPDAARGSFAAFTATTAVLSNLVSNVPAVLVLRGWPAHLADPDRAWLALAMASTLAGNLTLVGSVANLIVVEQARDRAAVGFREYARVGAPLTLVTLVLGLAWLAWAG